ncbi:MAG TPA: hypothetical protein VN256_05705 [Pyrinomonadaceae bacterium]|nr:hypothetical protein [Pyrinomonadaceae bacterium]
MSSPRRSYLLLFAAAALIVTVSGQALSQTKRKSQPRPRRPARVSGTAQASLSPTAALRAYYRAATSKDIDAARKYLSARTIMLMEEGARAAGKSLEEAMWDDARRNPVVMPEFSNERVTGETATVEIMTEGTTLTMPLVKEGGEWKVALDKMAEGMQRQTPPPPPAAEGYYSRDEEHMLFQAVGMTQDNYLILEVCRKLGLADSNGNPTPKMHSFIKEHFAWAKENMAWAQEHRDKEKARAYVMAHK